MDLPSPPQEPSEEVQLRPEQRRIVEELRALGAGELAQAYLGALRILSQPDFPGAVYFVGHACREVRNALPRWVDVPIPRPVDYRGAVQRALPSWQAVRPAVGAEEAPIRLPDGLYRQLDGLFSQHERSLEWRRRQQTEAMFGALAVGGADAPADPLADDVERWVGLGDELPGLAHLRGKGEPGPELERATRALATLEQVLWRRLVQPPFYAAVEALDEVLREANG